MSQPYLAKNKLTQEVIDYIDNSHIPPKPSDANPLMGNFVSFRKEPPKVDPSKPVTHFNDEARIKRLLDTNFTVSKEEQKT